VAYRFKSRATADVLMLNQDAECLLQLMGKTVGSPGILLPEQIPWAIERILDAMAAEEPKAPVSPAPQEGEAQEAWDDKPTDDIPIVTPRARYVPMLAMLRHSLSKGVPVTWDQ